MRCLTGTHAYTVVDRQGKVVLAGTLTAERAVDVSALAKGNYLLCMDALGRGPVQRLKFEKE